MNNNSQIKLLQGTEIKPNLNILPSLWDIPHTIKHTDTIYKLSNRYYNDSNLGKLIMYRNPELMNEFDIYPGMVIYIPMPLQRLTKYMNI